MRLCLLCHSLASHTYGPPSGRSVEDEICAECFIVAVNNQQGIYPLLAPAHGPSEVW